MTIQEQLNAINETFVKLHKDFVRFEAEKKSLSSRFALEYSRVQEKWDKAQRLTQLIATLLFGELHKILL